MTQEEKAKAYDEALKKLHEIITMDNHPVLPKEIGDFLFPQLMESGDERIRKDIIRFFRDAARGNIMVVNSESFDEWADYLENEEKQNPVEYIKRNSKEWYALLSEQYSKGYWKGKTEQKPTEWSGEDEKMLKDTIRAIHLAYPYALDDENPRKKNIDWLKNLSLSLKKRNENVAKLCSNEWSEEDERMLKAIIGGLGCIQKAGCERFGGEEMSDVILWIKNRFKASVPQPNWKPSEEQIEAVKCAALDVKKYSSRSVQLELENEPYYSALISLYDDLKSYSL